MKRFVLTLFLCTAVFGTTLSLADWPAFKYDEGSEEAKNVAAMLIRYADARSRAPVLLVQAEEITFGDGCKGKYTFSISEDETADYAALRKELGLESGKGIDPVSTRQWLAESKLALVDDGPAADAHQYTIKFSADEGKTFKEELSVTFTVKLIEMIEGDAYPEMGTIPADLEHHDEDDEEDTGQALDEEHHDEDDEDSSTDRSDKGGKKGRSGKGCCLIC